MKKITNILTVIASVFMAAMTGLTFADVVGRYFFNRPINGAQEIVEIFLGLTIFSALPVVTMRESHITVDFMQNTLFGKVDIIRKTVVYIITVFAFGTISFVLYKQAGKLAFMEMRTPHLHVPEHFIVYFLFAMSIIAALLVWAPLRTLIRKTAR